MLDRFNRGRLTSTALVVALVAGIAVFTPTADAATAGSGYVPLTYSVANPVDPSQLTDVTFGQRSFWVDPSKAYMDTPAASDLTNAVGINFNGSANSPDSEARLLAANGFKRVRYEIAWNQMKYGDPTSFSNQTAPVIAARLAAFKKYGLRPTILLNLNAGGPNPSVGRWMQLSADAKYGDTTVQLRPSDVPLVKIGYTGIDNCAGCRLQAGWVITALNGNTATLSQPLVAPIAANTNFSATTLQYMPFFPPTNADGSPNANYQATLNGWQQYVAGVTTQVKADLGSDNFDIEIYNELSFGSAFLQAANYYKPTPPASNLTLTQQFNQTQTDILNISAGYIHNPANGLANVKVGTGFSNQRPWDSAASPTNVPPGIDAIDKHPYGGQAIFPTTASANGIVPLDAQHKPSVLSGTTDKDQFRPAFNSLFPEYFLTALQTESLTRDLAPITTTIYGTPHGRNVPHVDGSAAPENWITEYNFDASGADLSDPANANAPLPPGMTETERRYLMMKGDLRFLTAYANKGVTNIDFYASDGQQLGLIDPSFVSHSTTDYPGDNGGGQVIDAFGNLTKAFANPSGAGALTNARPLSLDAVSTDSNATQFTGDGTAAHPNLYDRDTMTFQPFQVNNNRWVASAYVMTRDAAKVYNTSASSGNVHRFDMPAETYRVELGGMQSANVQVSMVDPVTNTSVPVTVVSRANGKLVIDIPLTDSVRLLTFQEVNPTAVPVNVKAQIPAGTISAQFSSTTPTDVVISSNQLPVTNSNIDYVQVQRQDAAKNGTSCGTYGAWFNLAAMGPARPAAQWGRMQNGASGWFINNIDHSVSAGTCARYRTITVGTNGTLGFSNVASVAAAGSSPTTTTQPTTTTTHPSTTTTTQPTTTTTRPSTTTTTTHPGTSTTTTRPSTTTTTRPTTTTTTHPTTNPPSSGPSVPTPIVIPLAATTGYRLLGADGSVSVKGTSVSLGDARGRLNGSAVSIATTTSNNGYWIASSTGQVLPFGDAQDFGSMAGKNLNQPIINMAVTPSGKGYWLLAKDGGVFAFGDAGFFGSTGNIKLNKPAVGITPTATGKGYWFVAADGGVFAYGDAQFYGSMGSSPLNKPVTGMTVSTTGHGYRMVATDGGIFSFGDAQFFGSLGSTPPSSPIQAMQPTHSNAGYYMVSADGNVYAFGDATYMGGSGSGAVAISY